MLVEELSSLEVLDSVKASEVIPGSVDLALDSDLPYLVERSSVLLPLCSRAPSVFADL